MLVGFVMFVAERQPGGLFADAQINAAACSLIFHCTKHVVLAAAACCQRPVAIVFDAVGLQGYLAAVSFGVHGVHSRMEKCRISPAGTLSDNPFPLSHTADFFRPACEYLTKF